MALSDNYAPIKQLGNGSTTIFSGLWSPLSKNFIRVELVDVNDPTIIDPQVLNTDFTLTFDDDGFVVTFMVAPTSQYYVVIYRVIAREQNTPYKTVRGFQGQVVENSFDRAVGMIQEQDDDLSRTPKFAVTSTVSDVIIEDPVANSALVWNAAGDGLENGPTTTEIANAQTYATNASNSADAAAASAVDAAASAAKLSGTSTTSLLIGTGSKVFTTQADKFFGEGTWLLITSDADEANYMHGQVTAYSGTSLTVNVTNTGGSGTLADWTIRVSGTRGAQGPSVDDGDKGDITISGSGTVFTIDNDAVTYAKMQNVSAASRLLGRGSAAGSGDVQELTVGPGVAISGTALVLSRNRAYDEETANTTATGASSVIPIDTSTPLSTEGVEILSVSITPSSNTARLRATAYAVAYGNGSAGTTTALSMFAGSTFLNGGLDVVSTSRIMHNLYTTVEWVPGSTSPVTVSVRFGPSSAALTSYLNAVQTITTNFWGSAQKAVLIVEEL